MKKFKVTYEIYGKSSVCEHSMTVPVEARERVQKDIKYDKHEQAGNQCTVFFRLYERKMKTTVVATDIGKAMAIIRTKVIIKSVDPVSVFDEMFGRNFGSTKDKDVFDAFKEIFGK
jgi:hypothetical protein